MSSSESAAKELNDKFEAVRAENQRLEKENGRLMQLLEREQNLKAKYEIDQSYLKSLRYTVKIIIWPKVYLSYFKLTLFVSITNQGNIWKSLDFRVFIYIFLT